MPWCSQGYPPDPSLRAMGARCWVRVPPLPSPPRRPLALGARNRSGGILSSVSPLAGSRSELALQGFSSPPSSRWIPALCCVAPWLYSYGAGPALAWPPTDASDATLSYSRCGCIPFSVVAAAVLVECSGGYPAPPAPVAVSISAIGRLLPGCSGGGWVFVPSPPAPVVGDGISRPLLRHLPQQYHPVQCRPALRHSHALAYGPVVEQVECRVQLQHGSTISRARRLDRLTVELVPNPS